MEHRQMGYTWRNNVRNKSTLCREFKENDIPPRAYDQCEGQLEVCDLNVCDFYNVKLKNMIVNKNILMIILNIIALLNIKMKILI